MTQNNNTNIVLAHNAALKNKKNSEPNSPFVPKSSSSANLRKNYYDNPRKDTRSSYLITTPTPTRKSQSIIGSNGKAQNDLLFEEAEEKLKQSKKRIKNTVNFLEQKIDSFQDGDNDSF